MKRQLSLPPRLPKQQQLLFGMNLSLITVFLRHYWQTKAVTLRHIWLSNCANWLIPEGCEQHHITMKPMANVRNHINMIGTLEIQDKQCWKDYLPTLVCNCTKNHATDCGPYYLRYRWKPRLPVNIRFRLTSPQAEEHSHNKFLAKLSAQLKQCYKLANLHQCKKSTHYKHQYD